MLLTSLCYALTFDLPKSTLGVIVIFAVIPLIKIEKCASFSRLIEKKEQFVTFLSTLIFPILSIELFSGINTHIWTGIIFDFFISRY